MNIVINDNPVDKMIAADWQPFRISGKVKKVSGYIIEAVGITGKIGSLYQIKIQGNKTIRAEVIGFNDHISYLMTANELMGVVPGTKISPLAGQSTAPLGEGVLGRVIDADGEPLDELGALSDILRKPIEFFPINPLSRTRISQPQDVGIKVINGLMTIGVGQRVGLFAGSGVGKSVLLGMITQFSTADVVVVSLIGERGREVKDFISDHVGADALKRTVIVTSPADSSPLSRVKAAEVATMIANDFRRKNKKVLLLMDSITRYAHALREIGLSLGEPPTAKGYPPSVFTKIPRLVEQAGNSGSGSVTAIYTVLVEGDDFNEPIADCARGILDGHIVLKRELAESGHFPAIDIEQSVSRVMNQVVEPQHKKIAIEVKKLYALYKKNEDYLTLGAYQKGIDPSLDKAIEMFSKIENFLQQSPHQFVSFEQTKKLLSVFDINIE